MEIKEVSLSAGLPDEPGDMSKAVDKERQINNIRLLHNTGATGGIKVR